MKLDLGQRDAWQQLLASVTATANSLNVAITLASKAGLLNELSAGSSDVVFIVAHSEGGVVYLPGKDGGPFSLSELEKIKRETAPNRIVVLITCEGGRSNEDTASFAEVILQNKLARTVFGSAEAIDARMVPSFLRSIVSSKDPIRETLQKHGLLQLVIELWQHGKVA